MDWITLIFGRLDGAADSGAEDVRRGLDKRSEDATLLSKLSIVFPRK